MSQATDFLENTLVDMLLRGQSATINGKTLSWSATPTLYLALFTAAPSDAGGGTEVTGGSYARVAITCSLANWAGTQSAGSTAASSGTGGVSSNNGVQAFPAPTASWGVVTHFAIMDDASAGNMLIWAPLGISKTINNGDAAPQFNAAALTVTFA